MKTPHSLKFVLGAACLLAASFSFGQHHPKAHHAMSKGHHITADQATKSALAKYKGKVVGKVALENEDGKMQYSVNVRSGHTLREVMVDANTGKIASVEVTSKADEAKEAAAEKKAGGKGK
jgi:hypothetical protein